MSTGKQRVLSILILLFLAVPALPGLSGAQDAAPVPVEEIEGELQTIEKELTDLEKKVDSMLEDLVDPKVSTLSVFFLSQGIRGQVPVSVQLEMDGERLSTKKFDDTDRLILIRGGALEIYSGISEPGERTVTVECFLSSGGQTGELASTGKSTFQLESRKAVSNFLEITLAEDPGRKSGNYLLTARHWYKEP